MKKCFSALWILFLLPSIALANNLVVGQKLPEVSVDYYGELMLAKDKIEYAPWKSITLTKKIRVVQALAGRMSAKSLNESLMAQITAAHFAKDSYQTTIIVNQDDAIWGTGALVKQSLISNKKEFPQASMVLDAHGNVAKTWQLKSESAAVVVLDATGQILFVKEGALTQSETAHVMSLLKSRIKA